MLDFQKRKLSVSVGAALSLSMVGFATLPLTAIAQDDEEQIEEIVVTGSLIKQADYDNANPVTVLSRDEMALTGITDVGDLIQRLPSMSGSPIGTTTNNGGDGSVRVDLRGLGAGRTLNLVNGKRMVDGGDFQTIPAAMIERIEILKDGAAAAYGADAVAGVINIITRTDFEGVEFEALTADGFDMDNGDQQSLSLLIGKAFDEGHVAFGIEHVDQNPAYQSDAPWAFFQVPTVIYPGGCELAGDPANDCYFWGSSRIPEGRLNFSGYGTYMNEGDGVVPYDGRFYNYNPVNYIQTPYEKTNVFGSMRMNVTDDVEFKANFRLNDRISSQELAPLPYNSPTDPAYDGTWMAPSINAATGEITYAPRSYSGLSPDNYYVTQALAGLGASGAAAAWTAGITGQDDDGNDVYGLDWNGGLGGIPLSDVRRRMVETTRRFEQKISQLQFDMTLTGSMNDMSWELYYNKGVRTGKYDDFGQFIGTNLANAMGPSADVDGDGNPECYRDVSDPATLIEGCVPFNFFGGAYSVTQDMIDYVSVQMIDTTRYELDQAGGSISGTAMQLPGGELAWAGGFEFREEAYTLSLDSAKQNNNVTGNKGLSTDGSYRVSSFFVEAIAPLAENVEASFGARYDDFSTYGSDTTTKVGLRWDITDDLAIRGTWGEVFRAPTVTDLFGGESDSFPTAQDPCASATPAAGCAQQSTQLDSQILTKVGGNPDLKAETGETATFGIVYRPTFGDLELSFTADYWQVELEDAINRLGAQFVLNDCYVRGVEGSCNFVNRRANYDIDYVVNSKYNAAKYELSGVDFQVEGDIATSFGDFRGSVLWSRNLNYDLQSFAGDSPSDLVGLYTGSSFAENKANITLGWKQDRLGVTYLGEYISGMEADTTFSFLTDYVQDLDDEMYHDLIVDYQMGEDRNGLISVGITNFTDEAPPYIDTGFNANTDPSTFRLFGRSYFVRLKYSL